MTVCVWPWSAARYRTRIARRAFVRLARGLYVPNERRSSADESRPRSDSRCKIGIGGLSEGALLCFAAVLWPTPGVQAAAFTYRDSS